jgi:hypothetical protein
MKPAWDALMAEHKDSKSILVADVDCTAAGKPLCDAAGVKGYPTIKYGDYGDLQDYKGGRDEKALKAFTKTLKPSCSPSNIDLCDAAKKKDIETFIKMDDKDLDKMIAEKEKLNTDAEETFKTEVEKLQKTYEGLQKAKEAKLEEVKESGLGLMKAVVAHKKKNGGKAEL